MPLPTWHIVDELRRAASFRLMMADAPDATEGSAMSDRKDADLMARAAERLEKQEKFKEYVHARLDAAGVEQRPDGEHSKAGCRIGDRLDIVLAANVPTPVTSEEEGVRK